MEHDLPNYLPSPARRTPTQEFDYQELVADKKFHAVVEEHRRGGFFDGIKEGTPEHNAKLKEIALAFVRVANEKRATLFRNRGIMNGRNSSFREAISCYNRALELPGNSPSRHVTLANRAAAYIKTQKYPEALRDGREAVYLCADYPIAHALIGYCHSRLGMVKEAIVSYKVALQLNPMDVASQDLLEEAKKALLSSGETLEAIEALEALASPTRAPKASYPPPPQVNRDPARHRRYLDSGTRTKSLQEMVEKVGSFPDDGWPQTTGELLGSAAERTPPRTAIPRPRLTRKLSSGSAQAFSTLTQLPNRLKKAIVTKTRGRSGSKAGHASTASFDNFIEDPVIFPVGEAAAVKLSATSANKPPAPSRRAAGTATSKPQGNDHVPATNVGDLWGPNDTATSTPDKTALTRSTLDGTAARSGNPDVYCDAQQGDSVPASVPGPCTQREPPSSAGDPVPESGQARGGGGTGGGAASPDMAGHDESLLRGPLEPSTPPNTTPTGECPGAPMVSMVEARLEAKSHRKYYRRPAEASGWAVFEPPPPETGPVPMCPSAPRLGPVRTPEPTFQIASVPGVHHQVVEQAPGLDHGGQPNTPDACVNQIGGLVFKSPGRQAFEDRLSINRVPIEKTAWTSSGSDCDGGSRLQSEVEGGKKSRGRKTMAATIGESAVFDWPEPICEETVSQAERAGQLEHSKNTLTETEVACDPLVALREGVREVQTPSVTPPLAKTFPSFAADIDVLGVGTQARTQKRGAVRSAIEVFERNARLHSRDGAVNGGEVSVDQFDSSQLLLPHNYWVQRKGSPSANTVAVTATRCNDAAVERVTAWVEAVTIQRRRDASMSEWFRDGSVLVSLVDAFTPGVLQPDRGERHADGDVMPTGASPSPPNEDRRRVASSSKNFEIFFEACVRLGVPRTELFSEEDVAREDQEGLERVVQCLQVLGLTAPQAAPFYIGPLLKPG